MIDHLRYRFNEIVQSNLERGEKIISSHKIQKPSKIGWWQDRIIFLTNYQLYYLQTVKEFIRTIAVD